TPSGIVDQTLRRPGDRLGVSLIVNTDSYGSVGAELDGSVPILSNLSLGVGLNGGRTHFADGTRNWYHRRRWSAAGARRRGSSWCPSGAPSPTSTKTAHPSTSPPESSSRRSHPPATMRGRGGTASTARISTMARWAR